MLDINKKDAFFRWYRENRANMDGDTARWAEYVIREFRWHDMLEEKAQNSPEKEKLVWETILPYMDGLDARLYMDKTLRKFNPNLRWYRTGQDLDALLEAYCKMRPETSVITDEERKTLWITRKIRVADKPYTLRSVALPYESYPRLAALVKDCTEEERERLKKKRFDVSDQLSKVYRRWENDDCPTGIDGYGDFCFNHNLMFVTAKPKYEEKHGDDEEDFTIRNVGWL